MPVLQSPHAGACPLWCPAELEQPIPAQLYTAVAQVLAYVYRLEGGVAPAKAACRTTQPGTLYVPPPEPTRTTSPRTPARALNAVDKT